MDSHSQGSNAVYQQQQYNQQEQQTLRTQASSQTLQHKTSVPNLNPSLNTKQFQPSLPSESSPIAAATTTTTTTTTTAYDRKADALATLKLRRQTILNTRLRKELSFKRIPASEACSSLVAFTQNVQGDPTLHDYCVPSVFGDKPAYMGPDGLPAAPPAALIAGYDGQAMENGAVYDGKGQVYYEEEKKTLLSPVSGKFSTGGGSGGAATGGGHGNGGCCTIM
ncbi:uncharacterized protein SAPINGB_P003787 [Magnusiomyces paraingens]|uniref:G protein gamma domain-containing protein n=1 Tax=Magnusiomyces paraingens TaxID=2606893 RepID=A0A5E8BRZ9_9ASCO|nr:uncharacterized protein SAPINGB_P003787 [Saprochaete ingens]VVT53861.1 unnamed protein product [Saprochaete ingens]